MLLHEMYRSVAEMKAEANRPAYSNMASSGDGRKRLEADSRFGWAADSKKEAWQKTMPLVQSYQFGAGAQIINTEQWG